MTLSLAQTTAATTACDALVVGALPKSKGVEIAAHGFTEEQLQEIATKAGALGSTGKSGEVTKLTGVTGVKAPLILVVGLGDLRKTLDLEALRRANGNAVRSLAVSYTHLTLPTIYSV